MRGNWDILPVNSFNYNEGTGFFIGRYFITCGHVIEQSDRPFIHINGNRLFLKDPVFFENSGEPDKPDIAIYNIKDYAGQLTLSDTIPDINTSAQLIGYKGLGTDIIDCNVTIGPIKEGLYISGESDDILTPGTSGSPLLNGNNVIGILTKGNNRGNGRQCIESLPLNFCFFLSASAIKGIFDEIIDTNTHPK